MTDNEKKEGLTPLQDLLEFKVVVAIVGLVIGGTIGWFLFF